ncbi:unnamed protein product [Acanthosepion pharaonis]|uniref:Uncharacterized protein n=1 Tax=Acanthosepion pharaonis TaxID=158019 RepID=A0A812BVR2_ACAPH|nr:unnamed protein product [Sepia pharaonis]
MFHPSLHCCPLSAMTFPVVDLRGAVLFCTGPIAILMPSYIPLMFHVAKAVQCIVSRKVTHLSVAESPVCEVRPLVLKPLGKLLHKAWLAYLADINARIPLLLATAEPLELEFDLAEHQGVVCVTVRAVCFAYTHCGFHSPPLPFYPLLIFYPSFLLLISSSLIDFSAFPLSFSFSSLGCFLFC